MGKKMVTTLTVLIFLLIVIAGLSAADPSAHPVVTEVSQNISYSWVIEK